MNGKNAHAGHRERMRKRFLDSGQEGLFDHELLELLMFYARPVVNTNGIAHALADEFGNTAKVLSAGSDMLMSVKGVGEAGAAFLKLMYDFGTDYLRNSHSSETLLSNEQLFTCIAEQFSDSSSDICTILCLSSKYELLRVVTVPTGDILTGRISPREMAAIILRSNASSVCAGINHGYRIPVPDDRDYATVHFFGELLSAVGISFRDFIIAGGGSFFSMRGSGAFTF
ncbi:MAG: RadC family protein [Ruminococcus sp.]|uniref:JAB domain-containing protein n=1 Tax=Ruminococcus sp. TaxID=41978 RepID=UPI001B7BC079|nr:JAB domain-containing protein [Ruminococcus sp.]MBP5578484.1 RadC family protein [Ruminococcus sp.]